jgi:hypothetical protein
MRFLRKWKRKKNGKSKEKMKTVAKKERKEKNRIEKNRIEKNFSDTF